MDYNEKLLNEKLLTDINPELKNKYSDDKSLKVRYQNVDAFHHANIFSKLFFCWVNKIFKVT